MSTLAIYDSNGPHLFIGQSQCHISQCLHTLTISSGIDFDNNVLLDKNSIIKKFVYRFPSMQYLQNELTVIYVKSIL